MTATADPSHLVIEQPCAAEVALFMQEMEAANRARIFRDMIETGDCGFCFKQSLRLYHTGGRWVLTCLCGFRSGP